MKTTIGIIGCGKISNAYFKGIGMFDNVEVVACADIVPEVARAKAEERRAAAVAREQEMRAAVQEQRAKVVAAEAEVPKAMAEALRSGNLGVLDYYNLRNVEADTHMRRSIGGPDTGRALVTQLPRDWTSPDPARNRARNSTACSNGAF